MDPGFLFLWQVDTSIEAPRRCGGVGFGEGCPGSPGEVNVTEYTLLELKLQINKIVNIATLYRSPNSLQDNNNSELFHFI